MCVDCGNTSRLLTMELDVSDAVGLSGLLGGGFAGAESSHHVQPVFELKLLS